jgi:hypothetical protein
MIDKLSAPLTRSDGSTQTLELNLTGSDPRTWGVRGTQRFLQQAVLLAMPAPSVTIETSESGITFTVEVGGNALRLGPIVGIDPTHAQEAANNPLGFLDAALRADTNARLPR